MDLLMTFAGRRKLIGTVTLACAVAGVIISLLLPNRYTATTKVLPPQQNQSLAASLIGQMGALSPLAAVAQRDLGLKSPNEIYVSMLRSRTVVDALVQRFSLLEVYRQKRLSDARKQLEDATGIELGKDGLITVSVEDTRPKRAAEMANAYVEELKKLTQKLAVTEAAQRRFFFEQQLEQSKNSLADAEQALKLTQQKTGIIQLDGQAKAIIDSVVRLRAAVAAKEVELQSMRAFATERNPDVVRAEEQLAGLRSQVALLQRESGGDGNVQIGTSKVPEAGLEYVRRLREVKYQEALFELLTRQYEAAKLDEAKNAAIIQVLDVAIEPDRRSAPKRTLFVFLFTISGLLCAATYVLIRDAWMASVHRQGSGTSFQTLWTNFKGR